MSHGAGQETAMRTENVYWLLAAIAVAAVTIALAAFIVVLAPGDPNLAAAAVQQQVPGPKLEAMAESRTAIVGRCGPSSPCRRPRQRS